MNNDLRQQVAYKLIKIHKLGRVGADFDDKEADELINLILDEVKKAVEFNRIGTNKDDHESDRYYDKAIDASIKAIDNLKGKSDD